MPQVGILEAKTRLSALVDAIEAGGEPVVITRHGRPVARLTAPPRASANGATPSNDAERVARLSALGERLQAAHPGLAAMSWEEMKAAARE